MRTFVTAAAMALACAIVSASAIEGMDWAYPIAPKGKGKGPDTEKMLTVPGSKKQYTAAQIGDGFGPPDWFPDEHPTMPAVVANGRKETGVRACALCHLPSGGGHPESANMAGLNPDYMIRQMTEYKNGNRVGPRAESMIEIAKAITDEDNRAASEYFAKLKPHSRQKVVESDTTPRSFVGGGGMRYAHADGGTEPIGSRIILIPDTPEGAQRRNPKSNFVAYVPKGSIAKGKELAAGGGGKTVACDTCHGPGLRGLALVPSIAGKDPIYSFRQLYDIQQGRRKGGAVVLMNAVVNKLTVDDMIALSAYTASLSP
jgi:cytochrome c553